MRNENKKFDETEEPKETFLNNSIINEVSIEDETEEQMEINVEPKEEKPTIELDQKLKNLKEEDKPKEKRVEDLNSNEFRLYQRTGIIPK